jgi:hypothetical protein
MKKIIKLIILILCINIISFCSKDQDEKLAKYSDYNKAIFQEFISYNGDVVEQAKLINLLDEESKKKFLEEFLPDSSFFLGAPDEWFTLAEDGTVVVDLEANIESSALKFATWSMDNNELIIQSDDINILGYRKLIASDFLFEVVTWNKGKENESKHLMLKMKIKEIIPEDDDEFYEYRYIGHVPATEKIKEYYRKKNWEIRY